MNSEPPPIADPHGSPILPHARVRRTWKTALHVVVYLLFGLLISWVDFAMAQVAFHIGRGAKPLSRGFSVVSFLTLLLLCAALFSFYRAWTVWKEGEPAT